jgi:hypothetical protein
MTKLIVAFSYFANALSRLILLKTMDLPPNIVILVSNAFSDDGSHTPLATVWKPGIPHPIVRRCSEGAGKQVCCSATAGPVCM